MYDQYKQKILSFYSTHKRMPVYREMMNLFGFKSKNAVYKLVQKLLDEGVIEKDSSGRLIPNKLVGELPLLGTVKAGFPAPAEEQILDSMNLDDFLVKKKDATYLLEVDGDSMIDAHIAPGDLVIAERTNVARDGDIVIAEVDGEWTMKYFKQRLGRVWLEPANKNYKPIYPTEELRIAAVVKGVVRKYGK
jgi:SOS regulatory protein LexA